MTEYEKCGSPDVQQQNILHFQAVLVNYIYIYNSGRRIGSSGVF